MPYVSTTWLTGDTITAVLMNKGESQYAACSNDYAPSTFTAGSTANLFLDATEYTASLNAMMCIAIIPIPYWIADNSTLRLSADLYSGAGADTRVYYYSMASGSLAGIKYDPTINTNGPITGLPVYFYKGHNYHTATGEIYDATYKRIGAMTQNDGTSTYDGRYIDIKIGGIRNIGIFFGGTAGAVHKGKNFAIQHNGSPVYATTIVNALAHVGG